jgi:hypothetical protein
VGKQRRRASLLLLLVCPRYEQRRERVCPQRSGSHASVTVGGKEVSFRGRCSGASHLIGGRHHWARSGAGSYSSSSSRVSVSSVSLSLQLIHCCNHRSCLRRRALRAQQHAHDVLLASYRRKKEGSRFLAALTIDVCSPVQQEAGKSLVSTLARNAEGRVSPSKARVGVGTVTVLLRRVEKHRGMTMSQEGGGRGS